MEAVLMATLNRCFSMLDRVCPYQDLRPFFTAEGLRRDDKLKDLDEVKRRHIRKIKVSYGVNWSIGKGANCANCTKWKVVLKNISGKNSNIRLQ